ncbi:hypothetical protein [Trichormus azollae]|uniref:hypothetical protein n=1 Tax=Trichormus azollae TaxID=1164 RepID=UPI00325E71BA
MLIQHPYLKNLSGKVIYILYLLPKGLITLNIVLAIMEIEAWFLVEYNHLLKLYSSLIPGRIQEIFGFNPQTENR